MARQTVLTEKKKRGPKPTGVGQLVGVRLQPDDLAALDAMIAASDDPKPTRPEAIRRVLVKALHVEGHGAPRRQLTDQEIEIQRLQDIVEGDK